MLRIVKETRQVKTMSVEQIVGFDAREMWQDFSNSFLWPASRRESMLIRQDIVKPLSTQTYVWPSVFDILTQIDNGEPRLYQDSRLKKPGWIGTLNLWENLQVLEDHLTAGWGHNWEPCWLIAITVLPKTFSTEEQTYWHTQLVPTVPTIPDDNWPFLGFDLSDGYLLSGLMGCGHSEADKALIPYLNDYHLFTDLNQALKFREDINAEDAGHAPFFVFGLRLIKDSATGKSWKGKDFMTLFDDNS